MIYVAEIVTPADSKKSTKQRVWGGVITNIEVMFPPGPQGDLRVWIMQGGHPIAPINEGMYFASDDETISYKEFIPLGAGWNVLTIHTKNLDKVNSHMCRVRINVLPKLIADPSGHFRIISSRLGTLLRRIGVV